MNNVQALPHAFASIPDRETSKAHIHLDGIWEFKATDESEWLQAEVPGTVHTHLMKAGRLEDPYYRDNEFKVQWVEKKEWEYRRTFAVSESVLQHDSLLLHCYGLDTIAEIYLNGLRVALTENMFIEFEFDIKPFLAAGENRIHIIFRSPIEWSAGKVASEPRFIWEDEKSNSFFLRKSGTDFGWDWGLRLLTCGIWRPIRIDAYSIGRVTDLHVLQDLSEAGKAYLTIHTRLESLSDHPMDLQLDIRLDDEVLVQKTVAVTSHEIQTLLTIDNPQLWWPNDWGSQPLYTVTASLKSDGESVHERKVRIGLRTIEIIQEPDDRGSTFGCKVNGHLIFCKGANWIPAGIMRDQLSEEHYLHLLASCKESHFNMIRIWGGGIYEAECFYDYCDENGIMIWHDFTHAVGPYLDDAGFLENVRQETANVVRRLRHRPSIALWCGNNEQESSMPTRMKNYHTVTWEGYDACFNEVIPQTVAKVDPQRPYWPCSPHHPLDRAKLAPDYRTASGDAHVWDVWHDEKRFSWYEDHLDFRFVSEYGLWSFPVYETILSFTEPEDRSMPSRILDLHNKAGKLSLDTENMGNERIMKYMATYFKIPASFEKLVYVNHILHGEAMKIGSEAYRRNYPSTTGALYWQLNDDWPTISGSSMDYYGRWKAVQYMARHFFHPVLASGKVSGSQISIWGVNDYLYDISAELQWTLASFDGRTVKSGKQPIVLPANMSSNMATFDFTEDIGENPEHATYRNTNYESRSQYYMTYRIVKDGVALSSNVSFFTFQKYLRLVDPRIFYEIRSEQSRVFISLRAEHFAAYVELGFGESYARFSDNYFHLLPGEVKEVELMDRHMAQDAADGRLRVRSLYDSYQAEPSI